MGSGKSTVGRILARELGTFFMDSDSLIEAREGRSVADIFANEGEAYFRALERQCLEWVSGCVQRSVISTGGGLPIYAEGIGRAGTVVFLKSDIDTLVKRIEQDGKSQRPLAEQPERLRKIYAERLERYEALSHLVVDANRAPEEVADTILKLLPDRTA